MFENELIEFSEYPSGFNPNGAQVFVGVDKGAGDFTCEVKGFFDPETGKFHIQDCVFYDDAMKAPA